MLFFLFVNLFLKFSLLAFHISLKLVIRAFSLVIQLSLNESNRHKSWLTILPLANHIFQDYIIFGQSLLPLSQLSFSCLEGNVDHHFFELFPHCKHIGIWMKSDINYLARATLYINETLLLSWSYLIFPMELGIFQL